MKSKNNYTKFQNYDLNKNILKDILAVGYTTPTSIQQQCVPLALDGKDVIGIASEGSGKKIAFSIPIIQHVAHKMDMAALVLTPTHELAEKTANTLVTFGKSSGARVALLAEGTSMNSDFKALSSWPNILVATPERLIEHIQSRTVDLSKIEILTIHEVNQMYNLGFMKHVKQITGMLPQRRQTMVFTSKMPKKVEYLIKNSLRSPKKIDTTRTLAQTTRTKVTTRTSVAMTTTAEAQQKLFRLHEDEKLLILMDLLRQKSQGVLIFARTKRKVDQLVRRISALNNHVVCIHSDEESSKRKNTIEDFRKGKHNIVVAEDTVAKKIDMASMEYIINYDFPVNAEEYIHIISRTPRAASNSIVTSLVTHSDLSRVKNLEKMISSKFKLIQLSSNKTRNRTNENQRRYKRRPKRRTR